VPDVDPEEGDQQECADDNQNAGDHTLREGSLRSQLLLL